MASQISSIRSDESVMKASGEQSSGERDGGSEGEDVPMAAAQEGVADRKPNLLRRFWDWVQRDKVASAVAVAAILGLFAAVVYCYVLGARMEGLIEKHQEDIKKYEGELAAAEKKAATELREFKCQLYDQALVRFNERCKVRGILTDYGTCEYSELVDGQRYEIFYPPAQGLERLCRAGAIP